MARELLARDDFGIAALLVVTMVGIACFALLVYTVGLVQKKVLLAKLRRGDYNLEELRVKRLPLPLKQLDKLCPVLTYRGYLGQQLSAQVIRPPNAYFYRLVPRPWNYLRTVEIYARYNPSACGMCLETYSLDSLIRRLPCNHIFHLHCISPHLSSFSSLCPLCNRSVIRDGYIPPQVSVCAYTVERARRKIREQKELVRRAQDTFPEHIMSEKEESIEIHGLSLWQSIKLRMPHFSNPFRDAKGSMHHL